MYLEVFLVLIILEQVLGLNGTLSSQKPRIRVQPGPATHSCNEQQVTLTRKCLSNFLGNYGYSLDVNGTLPGPDQRLFDRVMIDSSNLCKRYSALESCLGSKYQDCLTLQTLSLMTYSNDDATWYVGEWALFELYCSNSKRFIEYFECEEKIKDDDLNRAILDHCDDDWHNPECEDMATVSRCQLVIFKKDCGKNIDKSFCAYNTIKMRMFGYDTCENMPCSTGLASKTLVFFLFPILAMAW